LTGNATVADEGVSARDDAERTGNRSERYKLRSTPTETFSRRDIIRRMGEAGSGHRPGQARQAAGLLIAAGLFTVANNYLPGAGQLNIRVLNLIGLTAIVLGVVAYVPPWQRWSPWASIVFAPLAFTLIALADRFGGVSHYSYAVYFVLAFTWVGLAFPARTSFLLAPFAALAYVVPGLTNPHGPAGSVSSVTVAIPVCVLVAETVARTMQKVTAAVATSHQQETALHEAEARFRLAFTNAPIGMALTSLDGRFLQVNEALCQMLGRSEEQLTGALVPSLTHPEDRAADQAAMAEMRAGKTRTFHTEKRYLRSDGQPVWVRLHAGVVDGEDGLPHYFVSQMEDITERKRTEAALREEGARFRLSFDNAPIGKALVAPDGRFLEVNPALCGIVGYTRDELLAKTFQDITHPDDLDADLEFVRHMLVGELGRYSMEKRYFHADGHVVWVNLFVSLVRDDINTPLYFISQIDDITERKRTEAALRASEERTRRILETAGEAFVAMNQHGLITNWNRQAEVTFGWPATEILGRRLDEVLIPPDLREAHRRGLARFLAKGEGPVLGQRVELSALHRAGHQIPVELVVWALPGDDEWTFNAFLRDISQRKAMEEELARLATVDELTGLRNRRGFQAVAEPLARMAERNQRDMALLYIDLDNLKRINDEHGHTAGDQALVALADLLRATFRESDVLARLGGDEFVVLLPENGLEAKIWMDRLQELADRDPRFARLSFSVGVAGYDCERLGSIDALIREADAAMYREKISKRSHAV
jgi:diguanylate cyclase (GGDEF)-like protein/PAS domain S-box-containing protein